MGSDASISTYWRIHKHRGLIWVAADEFIICQGCHNDLALVWLRRNHDGNKKPKYKACTCSNYTKAVNGPAIGRYATIRKVHRNSWHFRCLSHVRRIHSVEFVRVPPINSVDQFTRFPWPLMPILSDLRSRSTLTGSRCEGGRGEEGIEWSQVYVERQTGDIRNCTPDC